MAILRLVDENVEKVNQSTTEKYLLTSLFLATSKNII